MGELCVADSLCHALSSLSLSLSLSLSFLTFSLSFFSFLLFFFFNLNWFVGLKDNGFLNFVWVGLCSWSGQCWLGVLVRLGLGGLGRVGWALSFIYTFFSFFLFFCWARGARPPTEFVPNWLHSSMVWLWSSKVKIEKINTIKEENVFPITCLRENYLMHLTHRAHLL